MVAAWITISLSPKYEVTKSANKTTHDLQYYEETEYHILQLPISRAPTASAGLWVHSAREGKLKRFYEKEKKEPEDTDEAQKNHSWKNKVRHQVPNTERWNQVVHNINSIEGD